jgi:hypothetical protein
MKKTRIHHITIIITQLLALLAAAALSFSSP